MSPIAVDVNATAAIAATILTRPTERAILAEDLLGLKSVVEMIDRGRIGEAENARAGLTHPLTRLAAEWALVRSGAPQVSFARIVRFLEAEVDWAPMPLLQRRAEEAMLSQRIAASAVLAFFHARTPVSPAGRAAHALALKQTGQHGVADRLAKALWRDDHLGRELEGLIIKAFGTALSTTDHRNRMEMYLFKGNAEAALRNAQRAGADHVKLAQARIAVARKSSGATAALAAVPASLRRDTSFAFAEAQHHRRKQEAERSAKLIADLPRYTDILIDGDEWWVERRLIARQLLDKGLFADAYTVAARHSAEKPQSIIEAEWHAGWIALRFLLDPAKAKIHFSAAARLAETPISVARTAYWQGRATEALGDVARAQHHFEAAARHHIAYYGQIAAARLDQQTVQLRAIPASLAPVSRHTGIRLIEVLETAGQRPLARNLILELGRHLDEPSDIEQLGYIAAQAGDARLSVNLGKTAVQRGLPLDHVAYPVTGMPPFESPVEQAMVFAIARQESAFDPKAVSHAGARGLMQLMLPTARETARRIKVGFDAGRLTSDPAYNAKLGAAHLADLLTEWRGSYVLTFAAYNAGSGNVREWIDAYGDPRSPEVDVIDWIERIPFTETRNYVQRVMENLQVYRARLHGPAQLLIAEDLARGLRSRAANAVAAAPAEEPAAVMSAADRLPNE